MSTGPSKYKRRWLLNRCDLLNNWISIMRGNKIAYDQALLSMLGVMSWMRNILILEVWCFFSKLVHYKWTRWLYAHVQRAVLNVFNGVMTKSVTYTDSKVAPVVVSLIYVLSSLHPDRLEWIQNLQNLNSKLSVQTLTCEKPCCKQISRRG